MLHYVLDFFGYESPQVKRLREANSILTGELKRSEADRERKQFLYETSERANRTHETWNQHQKGVIEDLENRLAQKTQNQDSERVRGLNQDSERTRGLKDLLDYSEAENKALKTENQELKEFLGMAVKEKRWRAGETEKLTQNLNSERVRADKAEETTKETQNRLAEALEQIDQLFAIIEIQNQELRKVGNGSTEIDSRFDRKTNSGNG